MQGINDDRSETSLQDYKGEYDDKQALLEANRCLYCSDAPCITACPTDIDIPEFIRKIATSNVRGSAQTIFDSNVLGMSCARVCPVEVLCVGDCVYNEMGVPPIQIGKLQRYATDRSYAEKWAHFSAGEDTGKSVALLGGGPASLAAAHMLRRLGHACTIYEKRSVIGGLNTTGVAPYKMKADRSADEVEWVLAIGGIEIETGVAFGSDVDAAAIEAKHDAVFFGIGLGPDRMLETPGEDLEGLVGAVDWIERMKLGDAGLDGVTDAVVIGGGNTAIDAVRELVQLGVPNVTMIYRGDEAKMSGYAHEWTAAKQEGARALWRALPSAYVGQESVESVRCARLDADKKPIEGSEEVLPAQLVLLAVGQAKLGALVDDVDGIETKWGRIVVGSAGATGRPGWYAGGDCANGGKEVVNAVAEGRDAAVAIDAWLGEGNSVKKETN